MSCPKGKILNPLSNRCVNKDGKVGKELLKNKYHSKSCDESKVLNPLTNKCVSRNGKIGKELLEEPKPFYGNIKNTCNKEWKRRSKLGQGGVGYVYTTCKKTCDYVMKIQDYDKPFLKEVKFLKLLNESGFTPIIYDAWKCFYRNKEKGFMIIEKLNTTTQLTVPEIRKKLLSIINKIHKLNIIFFDIHRNNILFKDNKVYLIDFGHAKQYKKKTDLNYDLPWDVKPMNFYDGIIYDKANIDFYWGNKQQKEKAEKILKEFNDY